MNTSELIQHIKTHIVTIAVCNGEHEHIFYAVDDWNISHEVEGVEKTVTENEMFDLFPNKTTEWVIKDTVVIKADPETGHLLCPKCGSTMTAYFDVRASLAASIDEVFGGDEVLYDHDLAEQDAEAELSDIACNHCKFKAVANGFAIDRAEFDAKHPAEEWKT